MKKITTVAVLSVALLGAPAAASAAPITPVADSGSGGSGSSEAELLCSPLAGILFATGSVEKPPLYDILCMLT